MDKHTNDNTNTVKERTRGHRFFQKLSSPLGKIYSTNLNPLYNLGSIAILLFVIACISGIYVFIFYNINPINCTDLHF